MDLLPKLRAPADEKKRAHPVLPAPTVCKPHTPAEAPGSALDTLLSCTDAPEITVATSARTKWPR